MPSWIFRRLLLCALAIGVPALFLTCGSSQAGDDSQESVDRLWEEQMLAGKSAFFSDGQRQDRYIQDSFETAKGSPVGASLTKQGIRVSDLRETQGFGLYRGGGWILRGGLLARISDGSSAVELYGKNIVHVEPASFLSNLGPGRGSAVEKEAGYEFYLLRRDGGKSKATIIKKWSIGPDAVKPMGRDLIADARGFLEYNPETRTVKVTITGLKQPVEERIDLSSISAS